MSDIIDKSKISGIEHLPQVNRYIDIINAKTIQESSYNDVFGAMLEASLEVIANLEQRVIALERR